MGLPWVVHQVAFGWPTMRASWLAMMSAARGDGGEDGLAAAGVAGEEVGFDEAGEDLEVGVEVARG